MRKGFIKSIPKKQLQSYIPKTAWYIITYQNSIKMGFETEENIAKLFPDAIDFRVFNDEQEIRYQYEQYLFLQEVSDENSQAHFEIGKSEILYLWPSNEKKISHNEFSWVAIHAYPYYDQDKKLQYYRYFGVVEKGQHHA